MGRYKVPRLCQVESCTKKHYGLGWCQYHYRQVVRAGGLNLEKEPGPVKSASVRDASGNKRCVRCDNWLPPTLEVFAANDSVSDGLHPRCRVCVSASRHGLNRNDVVAMLEASGYECPICKCPLVLGDRAAHIDHDHSCCPSNSGCPKCVRGVICGNCNTGLGHFKDDSKLLIAAAGYVSSRGVSA